MSSQPEQIEIARPGGQMPALLYRPDTAEGEAAEREPAEPEPGRPGPGLLLVQEIFGVSGYIRSRAADLAGLGYRVLVPELFFRLGVDAVEGTDDAAMQQAMDLAGRLDWDQTVGDAGAAFDELERLDEVTRAGAIGFCFGGGVAFNLAALREPALLVSYYGSALPRLLDLAGEVRAPSLHHFGLSDRFLDQQTVQQISAAIARPGTRIETYPGADHAFDGPMPALHHEEASRQAWDTTVEFLAEHLPVGR